MPAWRRVIADGNPVSAVTAAPGPCERPGTRTTGVAVDREIAGAHRRPPETSGRTAGTADLAKSRP